MTAPPDCLVVRTPGNPTFHWGNFLLFDRVPQTGEAAPWLAAFDAEIAVPHPQSQYIAISVDATVPFYLPDDFRARGLVAGWESGPPRPRARCSSPIAGCCAIPNVPHRSGASNTDARIRHGAGGACARHSSERSAGTVSRRWGLDTLVIVADPHDVAIGLYESLGFVRHDTMWRLYRRGPIAA